MSPVHKNIIVTLLLIVIISSTPLSGIGNHIGKNNKNDFSLNNHFAFAEKYKDNDYRDDHSSYSSQSQSIYKGKNDIYNDKTRHYYYYAIKKDEIQECKQCFFSELEKLDKKTAGKILYGIDKKFGDLTELCKLIVSGKIDRAELEEILTFIVFYKDYYKQHDKKQKYYYQNDYNDYDGAYNYKDKEEKGGYTSYSNNGGYNIYSQYVYLGENFDVYSMDNYDDDNDNRKYGNDNPNKYEDKNYINNNRYDDNYHDKDIKEQFIQYVLDCLFEKIPRVYVIWRDDTPGNEDIFFRASNDGGKTFGNTINISNNVGLSDAGQIAVSGDNVYVVWRDTTNGDNIDRDIFFRASNNGGKTFGNTIDLSDNTEESTQHRIAVFGDNVYVVWRDEPAGVSTEIFFRASHDAGKTFEDTVNLSDTGEGDESNFAQIAVSGDNVYVVWVDETEPTNFEAFFRASNDGGKTFEDAINLSNSASVVSNPDISVAGDNVYVVWIDTINGGDEDIFFRASTDQGETFEDTIDISDNAGDSFDPQILTYGNNVYVLWEDESNGGDEDIFFRASTDQGETFEDTIDLSNNDGTSDEGTTSDNIMIVSGNNVYVAWTDTSNGGDSDIFFRVSNDNGQTFDPFIDLSSNSGSSLLAFLGEMLVSGNNVYVAWTDTSNGGDSDIFFRVSNDNGQTFDPFIDLSNNDVASNNAVMSIAGNDVYVAWTDDSNGGDTDIFFRASNDNGQTFNPVIDLSNNAGNSGSPVMLVG